MSKLTRDQIDRIVELREAGHLSGRIAQMTGIKPATINYQLLKAGLDPWDPSRASRDSHRSRFTPDEDRRLLDLAQTVSSISAIARAMKRPKTSVLIRLMTLEVRAEAALEKAA